MAKGQRIEVGDQVTITHDVVRFEDETITPTLAADASLPRVTTLESKLYTKNRNRAVASRLYGLPD
ncbi:hypothetical protein BQ8482_160118 [Mesorhizobium delmotii]|uniref:Uncharacterized protein n=1 Tax=Mesorhizobium delmotii TaxID=1631247 RepID=A0A2P9AHM7_9HYPH|nr:hypothetical protein BQ8482_160118 [Mesorhizobium delmotii]